MLNFLFSSKTPPADPLEEAIGEFELPSFPAVTMRALRDVRDPDSTTSSIADLVASDPGLTATLLDTVNSAAFALRNEVRSVHHAVSLLGRSQLESMLIAVAVGRALPGTPSPGFESGRFWRAAARRATLAAALADRIDPSRRSESFTAALLADMALPLLSHHRGEEYGPLLEQWHGGGEELHELERQAFDWDHASIGRAMCDRWKFPSTMAAAIGGHHTDGEGIPAVDLVAVLREVDADHGVDRLIERARSEYAIAEDQTAALVGASFDAAEGIARMFAR